MCGIQSEITHNTFSLKNNTEVLNERDFENLQYFIIIVSIFVSCCLESCRKILAFKIGMAGNDINKLCQKVAYEIKYLLNTLISFCIISCSITPCI